jgi:hypothetical protein
MSSLPVFSVDLIRQLDESHPERSPDPQMSEREIWMMAGERRLVRNLVIRLKQLEESNPLEN